MESLYKARSSLIEHKRYCLSGHLTRRSWSTYIYSGSWIWVNVVASENSTFFLKLCRLFVFAALSRLSFWLHSQLVPHLIPAFRPPSQHFPYSSVLFTRLRRRLLYPRHVHRHRTPHQIYIKKEKPGDYSSKNTSYPVFLWHLKCHRTITD